MSGSFISPSCIFANQYEAASKEVDGALV